MSTTRKSLLAVLLMLGLSGLLLPGCEEEKPLPDELPDAVLESLREPKTGEFASPESAVRFLFDQVKKRDVTEATRVFPIRERFEKLDFDASARYQTTFELRHWPVPKARWQNLRLALDYLWIFDELSLACLGLNPDDRIPLNQSELPTEVEALRQRLDYARLRELQIDEVTVDFDEPVREDQVKEMLLGAERTSRVQTSVHCGDVQVTFTFDLLQIAGNWRVVTLLAIDGLPEQPGA